MMTDYSKLGLRVGLEIHQQLNSETKLFCRCPIKKSESFNQAIKRKFKPVAGELGDVDPAAIYEYMRNKNFVYSYDSESSCLVELDDDPPKDMNEKALRTALQACKMLNCRIIDELYVMRKTVIDGSSVSGFQRTLLVGMNGSVETEFGNVGIMTVCLEEDSAPAIKKEGDTVEYRLDRSLVPLIEIATAPDMHSPEHAKAAAEKIGLLLRSLDVVRGIGSIRQDVNVSIVGGARIEIKGFQELEKIPQLVQNEVSRQLSLIEIKGELKKRGVRSVAGNAKDVTDMFSKTKNSMIRKIITEKGRILAASLPRFSGLLKKECGHHTFGKELSSYAGAYGYGIMHSDEDLEKHQLAWEFSRIRETLGAGKDDLVLIVAGRDPANAIAAVIERAGQCVQGIPEETRVADGLGSKYTRPLPGTERMYPETDIQPIRITEKILQSIKTPKTLLEKREELKKLLSEEIAEQLVKSREFSLFERLSKEYKIDATIIATTLLFTIKDLKRRNLNVEKITESALKDVFMLLEAKKISKDSVPKALEMLCQGKTIADIARSLQVIAENELRKIIKEAVKSSSKEKESVLMGLVMKKVQGKADGSTVMRILREEMK